MLDIAPFLESDPLRLASVADGAGLLVGSFCVLVAVAVGSTALLVVAVGLGAGATLAVRSTVRTVASARRSRALGAAPALVSRAVLRTRIAPTAEGAAAFAADTDGRLSDHLEGYVRRARGTPRSGLAAFASSWRDSAPALYRALTLVDAAAEAPDDERARILDRAMDTVLDGTRERAADAADSLRGPATALYAFGVLLPLALVGVVPAAGAAGIEATLPAIVVIYDLLLPLCLCCAGGWLLANRPVAFPPSRVGKTHPAVPSRRWPPVAVGLLAGIGSGAAAGSFLPRWSVPMAAIGVGSGITLLVASRPIVAVRERVDELESALPDALYLVGRRTADGVSVERAIADAADDLDGVVGETFDAAVRRQRQLRIGVETAFTGEYGALRDVPSERADGAASLLGVAAREGPPAGRALVETADHLTDLQRVEDAARRDLARVTSTLGNTAAFFGPLVGGTTVALADGVGTTAALEGGTPETAPLALAVGGYVLLLAVVLTALSTGLTRGIDRAMMGYRIGAALCVATVTYLTAFYAAGTVAGGL
jgi:hypothetical protein